MINFFKQLFWPDHGLLGGVRSNRWPRIRRDFLSINPTCAACGKAKKFLKPLEIHHIQPYNLFPEKELEFDNLITLCRLCHLLFGHLDSFRSYNLNVKIDTGIMLLKIKSRP